MNYLVCAINMKYYQHSKKMVPVLSHINTVLKHFIKTIET